MTVSAAPVAARPVTPMSILAARLETLVAQVAGNAGVPASVRAELLEIQELASGLDPYLERWTSPESEALRELDRRTRAQDWAGAGGALEQEMLSGHVEGQLLKMLIHATGARRVLEIGMFTGYSALAMAEAMPDDGRVVACEIDAEVAEFARRCFGRTPAGDRIDIRVGPAVATLAALAETHESFDLVFIDADKAGYAEYLRVVLDTGLLGDHGLICVDNTLMQGQPWSSGRSSANGLAIADFNRAVAADPRIEQVIIPLRDGLTLIRRVET